MQKQVTDLFYKFLDLFPWCIDSSLDWRKDHCLDHCSSNYTLLILHQRTPNLSSNMLMDGTFNLQLSRSTDDQWRDWKGFRTRAPGFQGVIYFTAGAVYTNNPWIWLVQAQGKIQAHILAEMFRVWNYNANPLDYHICIFFNYHKGHVLLQEIGHTQTTIQEKHLGIVEGKALLLEVE